MYGTGMDTRIKTLFSADLEKRVFSYIPAREITPGMLINRYRDMREIQARRFVEISRYLGYHEGLRSEDFGNYADPRHILVFSIHPSLGGLWKTSVAARKRIMLDFYVGRAYVGGTDFVSASVACETGYVRRNGCRTCCEIDCPDHAEVGIDHEIERRLFQWYMEHGGKKDVHQRDEFAGCLRFKMMA